MMSSNLEGIINCIKKLRYLGKKNNMENKEYNTGEITIVWQQHLCAHAGICVKTLPKVYNPKERPWIKPENATTEALKDQIARCPSGALTYKQE